MGRPKKTDFDKGLDHLDKFMESRARRYAGAGDNAADAIPPSNVRYNEAIEAEEMERVANGKNKGDDSRERAEEITRAVIEEQRLMTAPMVPAAPEGSLIDLMNADIVPSYDWSPARSERIAKACIEKCANQIETLELRLKQLSKWIALEYDTNERTNATSSNTIALRAEEAIISKEIRALLRTMFTFKENLDKLNGYLGEHKDDRGGGKMTVIEFKNATEAEQAAMGGMDITEIREIHGKYCLPEDATQDSVIAAVLDRAKVKTEAKANFEVVE